ncbi:MAG TPA: restriction endonuclease subunit S [Thermovirgaceae bacterium]|nr:restriction endonuclease subunit S [Thermovirgaceae bacterium]
MSWETKRLEAVADFCLGKMLDQKKNRGEPLPYLANVNVRWSEFDLCDLREMPFEHHELERYGLRYGDIVMCEGGEPGRCAIWKDQRSSMMIQKALHRIRPHECLRPEFLYYFFLYRGRTGHLSPLFTGTTIKHLPREKLALVEVPVPPHSAQDSITAVLSAYDDLIENNRRRIQLLEESARLLYKEWFVHLRFPGHEHVKITDGVPEGWERKCLGNLCREVRETVLPKELEPKTPYIGLEHMPRRSISLREWGCVEQVVSSKHRFRQGDILFGKIRPYFHKVGAALVDGIASSDAIVIRANEENLMPIVLMTVSSDAFVALTSQKMKEGSKMPRADWKQMKQYPVLLPQESLLGLFNSVISPILEQPKSLVFSNRKLIEARDLLLPRLMNGEVML